MGVWYVPIARFRRGIGVLNSRRICHRGKQALGI